MRKKVIAYLLEIIVVAVGGLVKQLTDLSLTLVMLVIIVVSLIVMVILYYPEIKAWWFRKDKAARHKEEKPKNQDDLSSDVRPWPVNPASGRNVAHEIMKAETVQEARSLFNDHRAEPSPVDSDWTATAILNRLHEEGSENEFTDLSMELYEDGIDISSPPYIEEELGIRKR